jgi:hypothetical protein
MGNIASYNSTEKHISESSLDFSDTSPFEGGFTETIDVAIEEPKAQTGGSCGKETNLRGGGSDSDHDHINVFQAINERVNEYAQEGGAETDSAVFFKQLEQKLNAIQDGGALESPFVDSERLHELLKDRFNEALQKGGYADEQTITRDDIVRAIQRGGYDDDFDEDSPDSEESASSTSDSNPTDSTGDEKVRFTKDAAKKISKHMKFPLIKRNVKHDATPSATAADSDSISSFISSESKSDTPYLMSSSSLATDDINLISFSPRAPVKAAKASKSVKAGRK